ncbi:MAG TPA: FAD-dependent oxidoreductase, partial [Ilumatobacteraceae bacterium]|nr:FAD-dependent oxidoreductase [Ilumatobacteraceae bacterium]
ITASRPAFDLSTAMGWKDSVVARLRGGVETLLRSGGVARLHGQASIVDGKTVHVATDEGAVRVRAAHLVLATGSVPVELADLPFGGSIWSSTDLLAATDLPSSLAVVGAGYIGLELGIAMA